MSEFYAISPLGFVGALFTGLAHIVLFGYGAVYATAKGLSVLEVSIFMIIITSFGALSQVACWLFIRSHGQKVNFNWGNFYCIWIMSVDCRIFFIFRLLYFLFLTALYSCMSLPMYSLAIAHTNDFLEQNEIVAASSAFAKLVGIGSILGPLMVSGMMSVMGPNGYHIYLLIIHGLLGLFAGLYRMTKRAIPADSESQYVPFRAILRQQEWS